MFESLLSSSLAKVVLVVLCLSLSSTMFFGKKKWDPKGKVNICGFLVCAPFTRPQHVYITGGSQGLGLALAKELARKGASITIVARTQSKLDAAIKELEARSPLSITFPR